MALRPGECSRQRQEWSGRRRRSLSCRRDGAPAGDTQLPSSSLGRARPPNALDQRGAQPAVALAGLARLALAALSLLPPVSDGRPRRVLDGLFSGTRMSTSAAACAEGPKPKTPVPARVSTRANAIALGSSNSKACSAGNLNPWQRSPRIMRVLPSRKAPRSASGEPRTTTRTAPPGRRKVSSCSSAQHRALDSTVREWTHLPL
jgi:hypothetical protein